MWHVYTRRFTVRAHVSSMAWKSLQPNKNRHLLQEQVPVYFLQTTCCLRKQA
jgi:hypothetical protein